MLCRCGPGVVPWGCLTRGVRRLGVERLGVGEDRTTRMQRRFQIPVLVAAGLILPVVVVEQSTKDETLKAAVISTPTRMGAASSDCW